MGFAADFDALLKREGGYVNNPADRGGETNMGITLVVARAHGYQGPMRDMARATAAEIYKAEYWDAIRLDDVGALSERLADRLFDVSVNQGMRTAGTFLQRVLNLMNRGQRLFPDLTVDGDVGPTTLAALHSLSAKDMPAVCKAVEILQGYRYFSIMEHDPGQEQFARGWFNRLAMEA